MTKSLNLFLLLTVFTGLSLFGNSEPITAEEKLDQEKFYGIKITFSHNENYDKEKWQHISEICKNLIDFNHKQDQQEEGASAVNFKLALERMAKDIQIIFDAINGDKPFNSDIEIYKLEKEIPKVINELEFIITIQTSIDCKIENKDKIDKAILEFEKTILENKSLAFQNLNNLLQNVFDDLSGQVSIIINC